MDREQVAGWLTRYIAAWRSNDRAQIAALFSADARYRYSPFQDPIVGADAIADDWLTEPDDPADWEASYEPVVVNGDTAVVTGFSSYRARADRPARTYANCFLLRFDDAGRCSELTEWFMQQPDPRDA